MGILAIDNPKEFVHILHSNGIKERQLAEYLKPEFWEEVLEVRRRNTARVKITIDTALYREACKGNVKAIKLFYERFDRWQKVRRARVSLWQMEAEDIIRFLQ